jgi:hypothetical protein
MLIQGIEHTRHRACAFVIGAALLVLSGWASADPPSRVARLGYATGAISFSPAGEADWVQASVNRPLGTGDRLWSEARARAEVQIGGAMVRMSADTGVSVLNLDDRITQLQLTEGTLSVRVRRLEPDEVFEVDTPNLAFVLRQPGEFRIEVEPDGNATTIVVRKGQGEAYGDNASYVIDARQPYRFTGTDLREYRYVNAPALDEFDRWASDRDRAYDSSGSARYVSPDVIGYQDLDANGSWRNDADYGNVWVPNRVAAGWAPYRDGHWAWVDPWGWTWVDDAPWGFAVSHYGRWANMRGTWGWVPGPVRTRAYYAPALVVFVGGDNFQLTISSGNVGGVAWFPLAPREVYRPPYQVSRGYFENVNQSNTVINNTVINNVYNNVNVTNIVHANRQVPGAVIAVPTTAFVQSQAVSRAAVQVSQQTIVNRPVVVAPPVAPTEKSVHGAANQGNKPPQRVFERPVVARTAPPAAHGGFAAQQPQLVAKPGTPLDDATRKELKPAPTAPAPVVKIVPPTQAAQRPVAAPPPRPGAEPSDAGGRAGARPDARQPPTATAPASAAVPRAPGPLVAPAQGAAQPRATLPAPAAQPQEQHGKTEQRSKPEPREPAVAAPRPAPQSVAQPKIAPTPTVAPAQGAEQPRATPPAPAAQPQEQHGKAEQRSKPERREPAVAAPRPPPQSVAQPKVAPVAAPRAQPPSAAQPRVAPAPPAVAPPAPVARQPTPPRNTETAPAAKQGEPPRPVADARPASPQPQPTPKAQQRAQEPKPAASHPDDKRSGRDEQKHEDQGGRQKD